ncbi:MAG: phage terminase large subunit [Rhodospirillales bacterium]|nr:phage terminase large subunit [Rhodospirillales bacterium]
MTRNSPDLADFKLFLVLWNQRQGMTTPSVHFRMADWLQYSWKRKETRLLLQAFRSCGKSTVIGLFAAWLLYTDPALRILVLSADEALARKMVRNVRRIVERHPLTARLRPDRADQWAADRFTVRRDVELRDPSMLARGISANITGSRADVIICDDVEVPNSCDTADKRRALRERLTESEFILVPGGTQLYIGTPHTYYTIYAARPRPEIGEREAFLEGFKTLKIPVLDENGESVWPERFTLDDIARMKRSAGPNRFASQMMLQPVNIAEGRLDPALLRRYDDELVYQKELRTLWISDKKIISCSAWWDPAFGGAWGDGSVLAVVFTDESGDYRLHKVAYVKADGQGDEATSQCRQIVRIAKALYLPSIALETNGIGKFLPAILRRELARARVPCAVIEKTSSRSKDMRILEAFDAVLAARALHVHEDIYQTRFITEMQEWKPGKSSGHDDGLDAVAGALSLEPVRIGGGRVTGAPGWRGGASVHEADTTFEV